MAEFNAKLHQV